MGSKTEDFANAVEPLANRDGPSFDGCMLASIAISLKRIADEIAGHPHKLALTDSLWEMYHTMKRDSAP